MIKKICVWTSTSFFLIPCFIIMTAYAASGQIEAWKNLGLYGGAGRQIAVDPNDANHMFLAAGDSWGQYSYVTTNAGISWDRLAINGGTVVYDPNNGTTIYLGKYRSADNGQNWSTNGTLVALDAEVQVVKPGDSQTLFAKNYGSETAQLFRSSDGGTTWSNVIPVGITQARWANTGRPLIFDPVDASVIYLTLERNPNAEADDFGIYKSTNGGLAWTRKDTNQAGSIIVHPNQRNLLLATGGAFESPVRLSMDTGETWQVTGPMSDILVYHPGAPDTVYTIGAGCALSTNFGLTWSDWFLQGRVGFDCDAVIPTSASTNIFVCRFDYGFFRVNADLSGQEERNNGIMEISAAAALVRNQSSHIVIGTERGVSASFDGAASWNHYIGTAPGGSGGALLNGVADLCFGYDTTQTVWAVGEGANISQDGGLTWRRALTNEPEPQITSYVGMVYTAVLAVPEDPQRIIVGAFDELGPADYSTAGLFVSTNLCESLEQSPLLTGYINGLVIESDLSYSNRAADSRLCYAAVGFDATNGTRGLYWSSDSGQTWLPRGLANKKVYAVAPDSVDARVVYASYYDPDNVMYPFQLRRSDDAGLTWTNIIRDISTNAGDILVISLATASTNAGEVYAAITQNDEGYIARSSDYGQNWSIIAGPIERINTVAAGSIYGAMNGGFYKYTNVAETAIRLNCLAADFDGDQLADAALYNTNGNWSLKLSSGGYSSRLDLAGFLGGSGYTAVAGDFDGDGIADPAVYQASTGTWLIKMSSSGYSVLTLADFLGGYGYTALTGDFDGDRLADPTVYQASTGTWKVKLSTAGYLEIPKPDFLGSTGWTAIAADFDGDRLADPSVYQASTESWVVMMSSSGYSVYALDPHFLGGTNYTAFAADFDGDQMADPTVAEASTGHWKIKLSGSGYSLLDLPNFLGE